MTQVVSLTRQGQISIPAKMLKMHKVKKPDKVMIKVVDTGWLVEPMPDIMSLGGALHKYAIKGKGIEEIMELEEQAIEMAMKDKYGSK